MQIITLKDEVRLKQSARPDEAGGTPLGSSYFLGTPRDWRGLVRGALSHQRRRTGRGCAPLLWQPIKERQLA
jgi:hypothetical protein